MDQKKHIWRAAQFVTPELAVPGEREEDTEDSYQYFRNGVGVTLTSHFF